MGIEDWEYYNHAAIPTTAPHKIPDRTPLKDGSIWKELKGGTPYFARWTTDFDCGYETNWWYCIKDTPFDPAMLPSKRRYEINKGKKNFDVRVINPIKYKDELYSVTIDAFSGWDEKYRPTVNEISFKESLEQWCNSIIVIGCFLKETNSLSGYAYLSQELDHVNLNLVRTCPKYERLGINAALMAGVCDYYNASLKANCGFYICDGSRNILHETAFQDYLEKYFGFRKAYCKLNLLYRKPIGFIVTLMMPFRKVLYRFNSIGVVSKINAVLRMEEVSRDQKEFLEENKNER